MGGLVKDVLDVAAEEFADRFEDVCERSGPFDVGIYCAGIGEEYDRSLKELPPGVYEKLRHGDWSDFSLGDFFRRQLV